MTMLLRQQLYVLHYLYTISTNLVKLLQTAEAAALMVGLRYGMGTNFTLLSQSSLAAANKATFSAMLLFITAMCAAKASVILLMMRLFNLKGSRRNSDRSSTINRYLCYCGLGIVLAWGIGSLIGLSVNCSPYSFTETGSDAARCPGQPLRWTIITAFDVTTEVLLVVLAITIVWPVRMSLEMKFPVVLAFAFRLP